MATTPYTSATLNLPRHDTGVPFKRADLRFHGVRHGDESYEARIYLNQPDATLRTPQTVEHGYAGSLYIFGHPHCWGDSGHCDVPPGPLHGYDNRTPHHLVPQMHIVEATAAIRQLIETGADSITVTVLPTTRKGSRHRLQPQLLRFDRLELVTYD
jgi:hypothetical protein